MCSRNFFQKVLANKTSSETWKVINKILHPRLKRMDVDPHEINKFFNSTAVRTTGKNAGELSKSFIRELPDHPDNFHLHLATYDEVLRAIQKLRSDCSTGPDNIPSKFKPSNQCQNISYHPWLTSSTAALNRQASQTTGKLAEFVPFQKSTTPNHWSTTDPLASYQSYQRFSRELFSNSLQTTLKRNPSTSIANPASENLIQPQPFYWNWKTISKLLWVKVK